MDLAGAFATVQAVMEITRAVVNGNIDDQIREKATELNMSIITLQSTIFELQAENQALLNTNRELEEKIVNISNWEEKAGHYYLNELTTGVFVYTLKPEHEGTEVAHHICTNCYQNQRCSVLSVYRRNAIGIHYRCPNKDCAAEFTHFKKGQAQGRLEIY